MDKSVEMELVEGVCEETRLSKMKEDILSVMASVLNYLTVSSNDYYYTQYHQECRNEMNAVYDNGASAKGTVTLETCKHFYECLKRLEGVTDTDDPDYYEYRRKMRRFIISLASIRT